MNHSVHGDQNITTGDIRDNVGVAIGSGAHASVNSPSSSARAELIAQLDEFIQALGSYNNTLSNSDAIRESAEAVRAEVKRPSPSWPVIRTLLKGVAVSVSSVAALTEAINNLETLITHIAR
jgi:hypothetical protein